MDFGFVNDPARRDLSLAPDTERTGRRLAADRRPGGAKPLVRVGCPLWSNRHWIGKLYPRGAAAGELLALYSRRLSMVELNSTHYAIPDAATVARWRDATPEGFRFLPKFPQELSHHRELANPEPLLGRFLAAIRGLGDRLGTCFLQLPPTFDRSKLPALERFLAVLPEELAYAVELRHGSWFENRALRPEVERLLAGRRIAAVITDTAGRRDVAHADVTCGRAMIRLLGNATKEGPHPTDRERVDAWVERVAGWIDGGLRELDFVVHQPDEIFGPDLGAYFIHRLNERCGLGLSEVELQPEGGQLGLFG